jgi:hypothetical protein
MTKVDVILATAIYCLPIWRTNYSQKKKLIWIALLAVLTGSVFYIFNIYAGHLVPRTDAVFNWSTFFYKFYSGVRTLLSRNNIRILVRASGILSIPIALVAILLSGLQRKWRSTFFWLGIAALPIVGFWSMLGGNSARHNLIPILFLCIIISIPLTTRIRRDWFYILVIMCVVNYLYYDSSPSTTVPSGRLFTDAILLKDEVKDWHALGYRIAHLPYEKIAVLGEGWLHPYITFEILRDSEYIEHNFSSNIQEIKIKKEGQIYIYLFYYNTPEVADVINLAEQNYFFVATNDETINVLQKINPVNKWISVKQATP